MPALVVAAPAPVLAAASAVAVDAAPAATPDARAASTGAAAGPAVDMPPVADLDAPPKLRNGIVVGLTLGAGLGAGTGYPNDALKIDDPRYYAASGWMPGTSETIFAMGALADYVNVGFFFSHARFQNGDFRSNGEGGGLRLELFPLVKVYPRLDGLGVSAQFGIGGAGLTSTHPGVAEVEGTQSFASAGAFYEWSFGHVLGGHFAAGPSLEYDAIWSIPFERHSLLASARLAFYGGP
jgi:hypothetical protein